MSILTDRDFVCPGCKKVNRHRAARSLNAQRSPQLVDALLHDRFQRFNCPTCNYVYVVEEPFVYIDFAGKLWIGHYPREREADWKKLERHAEKSYRHAMHDQAPEMVQQMAEGFVVRTVFGLAALRDKVVCFGAGLDDRWLEVLKLDILRSTPGVPFTHEARPSLQRVEGDELVLVMALPVVGEVRVPRKRLDVLAAQGKAWEPALHAMSAGPYVDVGRIMPV